MEVGGTISDDMPCSPKTSTSDSKPFLNIYQRHVVIHIQGTFRDSTVYHKYIYIFIFTLDGWETRFAHFIDLDLQHFQKVT